MGSWMISALAQVEDSRDCSHIAVFICILLCSSLNLQKDLKHLVKFETQATHYAV